MKTRQQPFEACVATKTKVTPASSVLGPDSGSASFWVADEVHVRSEIDIKKHDADRRVLYMPASLDRRLQREEVTHPLHERCQVADPSDPTAGLTHGSGRCVSPDF